MAVLTPGRHVAALNPGSSTLKLDLYRVEAAGRAPGAASLVHRAGGLVDRLGRAEAALRLTPAGGAETREPWPDVAPPEAARRALDRLAAVLGPGQAIAAIGCRVVHGGARFTRPVRVTAEVIEAVRALAPLAPLHNALDADVLAACLERSGETPVVAVFDTAFHHTLPEVAWRYALPRDLADAHGLRRYGFHGIAHRHVADRLRAELGPERSARCVTCHLGNGASLAAVRDGRSVETTMGLTPMEGLVMGTRSGDLDPGIVLHLQRALRHSPEEVEDLLNRRSGLLGLSGRSADVRDLERAARSGDARADLALEIFAYRAAKAVAGCAVALDGLDALAFSGGIGEHSASVRGRIARRLRLLGVRLDEARNGAATAGREPAAIGDPVSAVAVWVVPADENLQIARETSALLATA
jgi:acetate kinase